jgi:hypothetical protein
MLQYLPELCLIMAVNLNKYLQYVKLGHTFYFESFYYLYCGNMIVETVTVVSTRHLPNRPTINNAKPMYDFFVYRWFCSKPIDGFYHLFCGIHLDFPQFSTTYLTAMTLCQLTYVF